MEPRTGKVVHDAIVLDDDLELEEGASVTVWIGSPNVPIRPTEDELVLVREGQAAAARRVHLQRIRYYLYFQIMPEDDGVVILALWHERRMHAPKF